MTFNTGNPIGSTDARDLSDNAENFDKALGTLDATWTDRLGVTRDSFEGRLAKGSFYRVGDFATGYTLTNMRQTLEYSGHEYSWAGTFPKVVAAGATPATSGGIGAGAWVDRTDVVLRNELASSAGSSLVGFQQAGAGSTPRTSQDKMREVFSVTDKGASPYSTSAENIAAFMAMEADHPGVDIYVPDGVFQLTTPMDLGQASRYFGPGTLRFDNAEWWRRGGSAGTGLQENYTLFYDYASQSDVTVTFDGVAQAISFIDTYTILAPASLTTTAVKINIANGLLRLGNTPVSPRSFNAFANGGRKVQPALPDPVTSPVGMMNTGLGVAAIPNITTGENNTGIGSRALVSLTSGNNQTAVGFQALYRSTGSDNTAVGSVSGEWVTTGTQNTYVGVESGGQNKTGSFNTAMGWCALLNNQSGNYNTAVGWRAGGNADTNPFDESVMVGAYCGSFAWGGKNTFVGYRAGAALNSGSDGTENVSIGFFSMRNHNGADYNVAAGVSALYQISSGQSNVAVGHSAGQAITTHGANVLVGYRAGFALDADGNTFIGNQVATATTTGTNNVAVGNGALATNTTGTSNTAIGPNSGRLTVAGGNTAGLTNTTTVGSDARVSGDNQVQLGNASTTTYVYGTVQNRSDARDKADVRDTKLGIDFIMGLRPVDGRWDMRDDYVSVDEEGNVTRLEKDGSKKRERFHHWFIAQEVKALCDSLGVEFGGYQDHSVNGGCDVLSLGYDEFIPPAVKAIQQCWRRLDEVELRLDKLDPPAVSS